MKRSDVITGSEDTQCWVDCPCIEDENSISIYSSWITRCPKCGRGYRTEFVVWEYEPNEIDSKYQEKDDFMRGIK